MLKRRILDKKDEYFYKILILYDKDGYVLFYCVVEGGFKDIFNVIINVLKLLKIIDLINVEDIMFSGEIVLYFVCKNKRYEMCVFLLFDNNYKIFFWR